MLMPTAANAEQNQNSCRSRRRPMAMTRFIARCRKSPSFEPFPVLISRMSRLGSKAAVSSQENTMPTATVLPKS